MEENIRTEINSLGEFPLIDRLTKGTKIKNRSTITGIGDDAAEMNYNGLQTLVSTDLLIEGIHFDLAYVPLRHLGFKSVIVNLSDIYAMNATPKQITVSIAVSNRFSVEALEEIYFGIRTACDSYNVDLVGGDTTTSKSGLIISITAIGVAEKGKVVYRKGAQPRDLICVSGDLGAAYLGLQLMEREKRLIQENPGMKVDFEDQKYLIQRFLMPEARREIIDSFAKNQILPTSMIDISDGLSSEIIHICNNSETGAVIFEDKVPVSIEAQQMAIKFNIDPITTALSGGEDYELLFTINPKDTEKIIQIPDVKIIGEILSKDKGIELISSSGKHHKLIAQGWRHF